MKLLVVGIAGQVGDTLALQAIDAGHEVVGTYRQREPTVPGVETFPLDKTDAAQVRQLMHEQRPQVVVDTSALHNVDYCESHSEEAFKVNRDGTRFLAEEARAAHARFAFISTDFVFDGSGAPPYTEAAEIHPQSEYARSKAEGEHAALAPNPEHNLVVRPSVIYSWWGPRHQSASSSGKGVNFGTWLVEEVRQGREVRIIDDLVTSPTLASDLAGAILALLDHHAHGIYHTAGATAVDRYHFSKALVERLGLDAGKVRAVHAAEFAQKAPRPSNSSLDSSQLARDTGYRMLELPAALDRFAQSRDEDLQA
ncbi:MAG: SDR family oxidoreductase [Thermoplasmata archaeon]|nr:SDR family oxidoreductase [Thermoplasmata archaeon]MCI4342284.1 SDR family oxidoreductase [Thermoplasmata archaeon]